jgi:hypothetical protein
MNRGQAARITELLVHEASELIELYREFVRAANQYGVDEIDIQVYLALAHGDVRLASDYVDASYRVTDRALLR